MTDDASLDSFASADEDAESPTDSEIDGSTAENGDRDAESPDIEPAVSTYAWSPDGGDCADCGELVEKRWRAAGQRDGDLVCADCKEW